MPSGLTQAPPTASACTPKPPQLATEHKQPMNTLTTDIIYKDCPIRNILSHICGKWALLILYTLHHHGCMRFNSLHKHIPDISQKVLTSTLRSLEADGFVSRKIYAEVPPRVEYTLTERAQSFLPQAEGLIAWAQNNMADIMADRERNSMDHPQAAFEKKQISRQNHIES